MTEALIALGTSSNVK